MLAYWTDLLAYWTDLLARLVSQAVLVSYGSKKAVSVTDEIRWMGTSLPNPITLLKWLLLRQGALTSVACEFGGFFRTAKEHTQPDLQVRFIAARASSPDGISTLEKMGAGAKMLPGYTTQINCIRPLSSGECHFSYS